MKKKPYILGIESSCDDTSVAVVLNGVVLANIISSQKIHEEYGGVVPELASREHQKNIVPTVFSALKSANIQPNDLAAIAVTRGPGLVGSLLVGLSFAKSMSLALNIPLIEVNHMQGHIFAHFIKDEAQKIPDFPFLCLTVSGGHTQIVKIADFNQLELIGQTIDDAAGEAFDKIGKMLGLPYPAGPIIDKYAKLGQHKFLFNKPKIEKLDFSFSGLKTSVLYFLQKEIKLDPNFIAENLCNLCCSVQATIVDILLDKILLASQKTEIKRIALAGGVSANSELREKLQNMAKTKGVEVFLPKMAFTTDNAAMIAMVGEIKFNQKEFSDLEISPLSRYNF
jgi:N6-L-threonylcarbamoyladenine synthase